jgi:desert hedgehog
MDQLAVGDRVKVAVDSYSDVFMFTHRLADVSTSFVVVRTLSGHSMAATHGHYLYVNGVLATAASVKIGDLITVETGRQSPVVHVSETVKAGLYNPQTLHGDIVVNGLVASTYTTAVAPSFGHALLAPLRLIYSAFGTSTALFAEGGDSFVHFAPTALGEY